MASEFDLIAKYFTRPTRQTRLGIGDDAALISSSQDMELAISTDMLVAGTHFFHDADACKLGWKSLAVNISDMAAMGANPKWTTLAIALPEANEQWLADFSRGFFACADAFGVDLVGGDTTRGPLTISIQIMGEVPIGKAIQRNGAKVGDDIWVSGHLGTAAAGLANLQNRVKIPENILLPCLDALHTPTPRVKLGLSLRDIAHSCIDISDGLIADLGHVLKASNLGAAIELAHIACLDYLHARLDEVVYQQFILAGGDDYELVFTAPKSSRDKIHQLSRDLQLPLSLIGETTENLALEVTLNQQVIHFTKKGFDHFG